MSPPLDQPQSGDRLRGAVAVVLTAAVISVTVVVLHGPSTGSVLTGDSYQWVQHAHAAMHRPALLLADLDTFLRPSTTWTLVLDRILWGGFDATGFRVSSLAIHGLVALALAVAGRRLGLGAVASAAVALIWVTSPFADESAFVVAYRFQPLLLLSWLVLIACWPRTDERWTHGRLAMAVIAVVAAAAAKETWVVTPVLVIALELDQRRSLRAALRPVLMVGSAVAAYLLYYFIAFPGSKSYFAIGSHLVAKIPTQLAAFLYLREPMPFALELGWTGVLAMVAFVAMAVACLRWRVRGAWTALALFLIPTLPTIMVPYMPQRYLAIPYAGFLLLTALWIAAAAERLPEWRWAVRGGAALVAAAVIAAGAAIVRSDLDDYRRMAAAHDVLLTEAAEVVDSVLGGAPVIVVRDEQVQPLLEVLRDPRGFAKLPFTRHADPYGLIDSAALFEWVIADEGIRVEAGAGRGGSGAGVPGVVLVHTNGGFVESGLTDDLAAEAARWQSAGRRQRLISAVRD